MREFVIGLAIASALMIVGDAEAADDYAVQREAELQRRLDDIKQECESAREEAANLIDQAEEAGLGGEIVIASAREQVQSVNDVMCSVRLYVEGRLDKSDQIATYRSATAAYNAITKPLAEWLAEWPAEWLAEWLAEWPAEWPAEWLAEWPAEWLAEWPDE
jgi:hypothetical protein